jgi:hypothetical protein
LGTFNWYFDNRYQNSPTRLGKNKITSANDAPKDYETGAVAMAPFCNYLVINVSSYVSIKKINEAQLNSFFDLRPNTPGLRALQSPEELTRVRNKHALFESKHIIHQKRIYVDSNGRAWPIGSAEWFLETQASAENIS